MVVFACQRDSFQKEFSTKVVSCEPAVIQNEANEEIPCYEVICEDTILFPEGGGQPYDTGLMNDVRVFKVVRRGAQAVHFVEDRLEGNVKQVIDWQRRLDHMQQHSGQHLVTAVADAMFGYATTSWWLGEEVSFIELDTTKITQEEVDRLEEEVNEKIRQALPVTVEILDENTLAVDMDARAHVRGLPKDHVGDVRIVTIATVESNMCCGTHVTNLAQLQSIKLLGIEKGKKGKTNLQFLAGCRVLSRLDKMYVRRELKMNLLLNSGPNSHVELVDKLIKNDKVTRKNLQTALKDCAVLEIAQFKASDPKPKFLHKYRKEAEIDYVNFFIRELNDPDVLVFLAVGEGEGHVVLSGPAGLVQKLGPQVAEVLDGKGNGKGQRYQAKVKNLKPLAKAVTLCEEAVLTDPQPES